MSQRVLPVRIQRHITPDADIARASVRCPRTGANQDVTCCFECPELVTFASDPRGEAVKCSSSSAPPAIDPRADTGEMVSRTALHEVSSSMTTVTPDVSLHALRRTFTEHRLRNALVVDADGKLQGIVSRSDLTGAPSDGVVGDIMPRTVRALPEGAPLGFAVALMALDDISEVPLVTDDGAPTGVCHSLDVVRWLAGRLGYVIHAEEHPPR